MHYQEIARIAQQAWDKTKTSTDPVWNDCDPHHRQVFIATATGVINSGHAVNDFEHTVKRLANEVEERREAIAEVQAKNPTAHSDEVQLEAARRAALSPADAAQEARKTVLGLSPEEIAANDKRFEAERTAESKPDVPQINPPSLESEASSSEKTSAKSPRKKSSKKSSKKGK